MTIALYNRIISEIRYTLKQVYTQDYPKALKAIEDLIQKYGASENLEKTSFKNSEAFVFALSDTLEGGPDKPLPNLLNFIQERCAGLFSTVHILPFCACTVPNSTAIIDFKTVDPQLGSFNDFIKPHYDFKLMADIEINHVSNHSAWLQYYLDDMDGYENLFMTPWPDFDYDDAYGGNRKLYFDSQQKVHHGKPLCLLSTFGEGVVDLNYTDYRTFVRMLDVILFYATQNFAALRLLDAEFIWKDLNFEWEGHIKGHFLLKVIRLVLDIVNPDMALAVANPQKSGTAFSYLGSGRDEMQFIYNEALPALLLHAMLNGNSRRLSNWVLSLETGSTFTSLLNATASYDKINLKPLEGVLPKASIASLARQALENNGAVEYYQNAEGLKAPSKLHIGYLNALRKKGDSEELLISRFLASQAIQAVLPGITAVYLHSLLGSTDYAGQDQGETASWVLSTHQNLNLNALLQELNNPQSFRARVFEAYANMLKIHNQQPAFNPRGGFEVAVIDPAVFALRRYTLKQTIWTFTNTSGAYRRVSLDNLGYFADFVDLLTGREFKSNQIELGPYEFLWLTPKGDGNRLPKSEPVPFGD